MVLGSLPAEGTCSVPRLQLRQNNDRTMTKAYALSDTTANYVNIDNNNGNKKTYANATVTPPNKKFIVTNNWYANAKQAAAKEAQLRKHSFEARVCNSRKCRSVLGRKDQIVATAWCKKCRQVEAKKVEKLSKADKVHRAKHTRANKQVCCKEHCKAIVGRKNQHAVGKYAQWCKPCRISSATKNTQQN